MEGKVAVRWHSSQHHIHTNAMIMRALLRQRHIHTFVRKPYQKCTEDASQSLNLFALLKVRLHIHNAFTPKLRNPQTPWRKRLRRTPDSLPRLPTQVRVVQQHLFRKWGIYRCSDPGVWVPDPRIWAHPSLCHNLITQPITCHAARCYTLTRRTTPQTHSK